MLSAMILTCYQLSGQDAATAHDQAVSQLDKAKSSYASSRDDDAIGYGLIGLDQAIISGDNYLIIQFKELLGDIYLSQEDYRKSIFYYLDATNHSEDINDNLGAAKGYFNLGNTYTGMDAFEKAASSFTKSFSLYDRERNAEGKLNAMFAIGNSYLSANMLPKAFEAYEVQLQIAKEIGNSLMQGRALALLAQVHERLGNYRDAVKYGEEQYALIDPRLKASKAYSLAILYLELKKLQ